uniref:DUF4238 domain-containing protein n=1 Tax=Candidatus Kentrum sp. TUN TaxID=2126343 RepID=A0A450ZWA2_9GAMM|nr:MAG: Protein of unknown function (DUF4238) [Candidatus Kentron sp. TUN]
MSIPRKHHYLPQFYLEGFKVEPQTGKRPHIWQIEKSGDQAYQAAIRDTGCIRDYHSIDFEKEESDHKTIETRLSAVEAEQAKLVQRIKTAKRLDASRIEELSTFISLMRYRVPAFANHVKTIHQDSVMDVFKIMYQRGKIPPPPQELLNLFESKGIDDSLRIDISNWKIIENMFKVALAPESIGLLMQFKFRVYSAKDPNFFVTSDNPVALFHPNYDEIRPYGVGLATPGVELTFPLSFDTLILAGHEVEPGFSLASMEEVEEFNRRTIVMSTSYVFARDAGIELKSKIRELKHLSAGFVLDNLFHGDGAVQISRFIPVTTDE